MHASLSFWKFKFIYFSTCHKFDFFFVHYKSIVNYIHVFHFCQFYAIFCPFYLLQVNCQNFLFCLLQVSLKIQILYWVFVLFFESWVYVLDCYCLLWVLNCCFVSWLFLVVYGSILFEFVVSVDLKSFLWKNILQRWRWIQLQPWTKNHLQGW